LAGQLGRLTFKEEKSWVLLSLRDLNR